MTTRLILCAFLAVSLNMPGAYGAEQKYVNSPGKRPCNCRQLTKSIQQGVVPEEYARELFKLVEAEPGNSLARLALGMYYEQHALFNPALLEFEAASKLNPREPKALLGQVRVNVALKRYKQASRLLSIARARFPDEPGVPVLQYLCLGMQGDSKSANRYLDQVIAAPGTGPQLQILKATILMIRKEFNKSLAVCNQIPNWKQSIPVVILRGFVLKRLGRQAEAFDTVSGAFEELPYDRILCQIYLNFLFDEKRLDKALEPSLALLALTDSSSSAELDQAKSMVIPFLFSRSKEEAEATIDRVSRKLTDKDVASAFQQQIADIFDRFGRIDLALQHYRTAVALHKATVNEHLRVATYAENVAFKPLEALPEYRAAFSTASGKERVDLGRRIRRLEGSVANYRNDIAGQLKAFVRRSTYERLSPVFAITDMVVLQNSLRKIALPPGSPGRLQHSLVPARLVPVGRT